MGNCTLVGPNLEPKSLISSTHLLWSSRPLAEMPMTLTLRWAKSSDRRATSPSSVVQTGVKSPGCENRTAWIEQDQPQFGQILTDRMQILTQESPIQSWNLIGPAVVCASKSGAMLPRRREGIFMIWMRWGDAKRGSNLLSKPSKRYAILYGSIEAPKSPSWRLPFKC